MKQKHEQQWQLIPKWIWHPEGIAARKFTLTTLFNLDEEATDLAFWLSLTGGANITLNGEAIGGLQQHPGNVATFTRISGFPHSIPAGSHRIDIEIFCSEPMPVCPVSIHLSERLTGCIAYIEGRDFWLSTNGQWTAGEQAAREICLYGEEPYGDLENSPEWFAQGGYGDIAAAPVTNFEILERQGELQAIRNGSGVSVSGMLGGCKLDSSMNRMEQDFFYHLRKQREWETLRTAMEQANIQDAPSFMVCLDKEYNARFRVRNDSDTDIQVLWCGAESLYELDRYSAAITETFQVPGNQSFVTLPQGIRYIRLFFLGKEGESFRAELHFESLHADLRQMSTIETDLVELDRIFETSVHTNRICHQTGLWDGVKRDRLNWVYDFYLAGKADYVLWDDLSILKRSIVEIGCGTPYGYWMNDLASYTLWWFNNLWDLYLYTGDRDFLLDLKSDIHKHLSWVEANIEKDRGDCFPDFPR